MIDNNPAMYKPSLIGANEIVGYLFETYGQGRDKIPASLKGGGGMNLFKSNKGANMRKNVRKDNIRMKPLTLYGWEGMSYVKSVREVLTELGLAHVFINCAEGSVNRYTYDGLYIYMI
jgi:hypothetical protein